MAARNARTIKWLRAQPIETLDNIRALYAGHLSCPLDETFRFDEVLEDGQLDNETLLWVYTLWATQIDR